MKWALMTLLTISMAVAQERPREPNGREDRRTGFMEEMKRHHAATLETLKKENPDEYKRLMELKKSDRRRYYRELMKLATPDGKPGGHGDERDGKHRRPMHDHEMLEHFSKRFRMHMEKMDPERAKKMQELRQSDPKKAREMIRDILKNFKKKHFSRKGDERIDKLLTSYRTADEPKRKEIEVELRKLIEEGFDKRMQMKNRELESMQDRIKRLENSLKQYRESKTDICDKRLDDLLRRAEEEKKVPKKDPAKEKTKGPQPRETRGNGK